jgi:hypothetical protein
MDCGREVGGKPVCVSEELLCMEKVENRFLDELEAGARATAAAVGVTRGARAERGECIGECWCEGDIGVEVGSGERRAMMCGEATLDEVWLKVTFGRISPARTSKGSRRAKGNGQVGGG